MHRYFLTVMTLLSVALISADSLADTQLQKMKNAFESPQSYHVGITLFPKWSRVIAHSSAGGSDAENHAGMFCHTAACTATFTHEIQRIKAADDTEKLALANHLINSRRYILDPVNWGVADYWATPIEFMQRNGDCEDYAIAKYFLLRASGITPERMRIIILQDMYLGGILHAVLGITHDDGSMTLLDNQLATPMPASQVWHYQPVYAINEHGWWVYVPPATTIKAFRHSLRQPPSPPTLTSLSSPL